MSAEEKFIKVCTDIITSLKGVGIDLESNEDSFEGSALYDEIAGEEFAYCDDEYRDEYFTELVASDTNGLVETLTTTFGPPERQDQRDKVLFSWEVDGVTVRTWSNGPEIQVTRHYSKT